MKISKFLILYFVSMLLLTSCTNQKWVKLANFSSLSEMSVLSNAINNTIWAMSNNTEYIFNISNEIISQRKYTSFSNQMANGAICATQSHVYLMFTGQEVKQYDINKDTWKSYPEFKSVDKGRIKCVVSNNSEKIILWSYRWLAYISEDEVEIIKIPVESDINSVFFNAEDKIYLFMKNGEIVDFFDNWKVVFTPKTRTERIFLGITSDNMVWFTSENNLVIKIDLDSTPITEQEIIDTTEYGRALEVIEVDSERIWLATNESIIRVNKQKPEVTTLPKEFGNILFITSAKDYVYMSTTEGIYMLKK